MKTMKTMKTKISYIFAIAVLIFLALPCKIKASDTVAVTGSVGQWYSHKINLNDTEYIKKDFYINVPTTGVYKVTVRNNDFVSYNFSKEYYGSANVNSMYIFAAKLNGSTYVEDPNNLFSASFDITEKDGAPIKELSKYYYLKAGYYQFTTSSWDYSVRVDSYKLKEAKCIKKTKAVSLKQNKNLLLLCKRAKYNKKTSEYAPSYWIKIKVTKKSKIFIEDECEGSTYSISLYDKKGKEVKTKTNNEPFGVVTKKTLKSGVYYIKIDGDTEDKSLVNLKWRYYK